MAPQPVACTGTIDGSNQVLLAVTDLGIADGTGTGDGWQVTVSAGALETSASPMVVAGSNWAMTANGSPSAPGATAARDLVEWSCRSLRLQHATA